MVCERCGKRSHNVLYCEYCGERRYKAKLRIVDRLGHDQALYLFPQKYVIGRESTCDILLEDDSVSRKHANLFYQNGSFYIEDLHSKNGVFVNGEKCEKCTLENYDYIQIGRITLHFYFPDGDFPEEKIHLRTSEFIQETLLKISREIQNKNMLDDVLNTIVDGVMSVTNASEGLLYLPDTTDGWDIKISRNLQVLGKPGVVHEKILHLIREINERGQHVVIDEKGKRVRINHIEKIAEKPIRFLAIALKSRKLLSRKRSGNEVLGVLILRMGASAQILDSHNAMILESLANQAVVAIENSYLYNEALAKRKIDNELELAQAIQSRLLPREIIQVPHTDLAAFSRACNYVGGDYYDILPIQDQALALAIADISGKGIGAALVMSSLQGSLRAQINYESRPEHIVAHINQLVRESSLESLFATFFFCIYDIQSGQLRYVNAGHNPPVVFRSTGSEEQLKSSATVLGILEENSGQEKSITLEEGDVVIFYTDGLTEAMDKNMQQLGLKAVSDTVRAFLQAHPEAPAKQILKAILDKVERHVAGQPQHDDLTLLVLKRQR
ncbi:MAG: FHA domain-containing protein, partial [Calditrichaeota bacterium]